MLVLVVGLGSWAVIGGDVAGSGEPTVTFDGAACTYTGPGQFVVGVPQSILFVNTSDTEIGINVWRVADGTTIDDVDPSDVRGTADYLNLSTTWFSGALSGNEKVVNGEFYRAGDWLISCQVGPRAATDSAPVGDYPGAIIQVVEG